MSEIHYSSPSGDETIPDARTLRFCGTNGTECEDFVQSVRFIALTEGKEDDDRWMLHFATARLSGRALRWHAGLDKEIRKNWDLLVQALLDEYQDVSPVDIASSAPTAISSHVSSQDNTSFSTMLPLQRSIVCPGLNVGRLRIVPILSGDCNSTYVSTALRITTTRAEALQVRFLHSTELHRICIIEWDNVCNVTTRLPGYSLSIDADVKKKTGQIAECKYDQSFYTIDCWRVGSGGILEASYTGQQVIHELKSEKLAVGMNDQTLTFVQDFDAWTQEFLQAARGYH